MINYLYFLHEDDFVNRFQSDDPDNETDEVYGIGLWEKYIGWLMLMLSNDLGQNERGMIQGELRETFPEDFELDGPFLEIDETHILFLLIAKLRAAHHPLPQRKCPRLFISHRQVDTTYALSIAGISAGCGFAYWLDVLDPHLSTLGRLKKNSPKLRSLLTACIIEMALINCTHIISCLTPNSRGSMWIPYEYGRITKIPRIRNRAAAWIHSLLPVADFPEYMYLGEITTNSAEISSWLTAEKKLPAWKGCNRIVSPPPSYTFIRINKT